MSDNSTATNPTAATKRPPKDISLRDYFAGLAMQGMITEVNEPNEAWIAHHAYKMADAMLIRKRRVPRYEP
jgi:hypothetical protein